MFQRLVLLALLRSFVEKKGPVGIALFSSPSRPVDAAAGQLDVSRNLVAPSGPRRDVRQSVGHGLVDAVPLQGRETVDQVRVDNRPYSVGGVLTNALFKNPAGVDQDLGATGDGDSILVRLQHELPNAEQMFMQRPLGNDASPKLADPHRPWFEA